MALSTAKKREIVEAYQTKKADTGSTEVQIALLTEDIKQLTEHFKTNAHDYHSRQGLMRKVNERRSLLKYLRRVDISRYRALIGRLNLRDVN